MSTSSRRSTDLVADDRSLRARARSSSRGRDDRGRPRRRHHRCPVTLHGFMSHTESVGLMRSGRPPLPADAEPPSRRAGDNRAGQDVRVPRLGAAHSRCGTRRRRSRHPRRGRERDPRAAGRRRGHVGRDSTAARSVPRRDTVAVSDPAVVERFEYGKLAGDLAHVFDAVLANPPAQDGAANQE